MPNMTLLDIAIANNASMGADLIEETQRAVPEVAMGAARTIRGIIYKTRVRTALPAVSFRRYGEGNAAQKSIWELRSFDCHVLNPRWETDVAIAQANEDGPEAAIADEAIGQMQGALITLGKQFYYGATSGIGDALGMPGLIDQYDATNMVVDAGGTTANTGTSVWAVKWGPQGVEWLWGNGGQLQMSDVQIQRVLDANNNPFDAYCQTLLARPGLKTGAKYCLGRIKKLTDDSGKGLTDALLSQLYQKFPVGWAPDVFFATRRAIGQLQRSRTATTATGTQAPIPTDWQGIPIVPTDSISDTEALTL
jgi:hypothetical protein